jgi:hypothetical protein
MDLPTGERRRCQVRLELAAGLSSLAGELCGGGGSGGAASGGERCHRCRCRETEKKAKGKFGRESLFKGLRPNTSNGV